MKKNVLLTLAACTGALMTGMNANAQTETVTIEETDFTVSEVPCKTHYYSGSKDNWFIQVGAGIASPFVENKLVNGDAKHHMTANYNFAFGKWFSPYIGWRLSFLGGALHWDNDVYSKSKYVTGNLDFMWDMFNSLGGVNSKRVFSIVPFVGLGGAFAWDFDPAGDIVNKPGQYKRNTWTLPVSARSATPFPHVQVCRLLCRRPRTVYG